MTIEEINPFWISGTKEEHKRVLDAWEKKGGKIYSYDTADCTIIGFNQNNHNSVAIAGRDHDQGECCSIDQALVGITNLTNAQVSPGLEPTTEPAKPKRKKLEIRSEHIIDGVRYIKGYAGDYSLEDMQRDLESHKKYIAIIRTKQRHYRIAEKRGF